TVKESSLFQRGLSLLRWTKAERFLFLKIVGLAAVPAVAIGGTIGIVTTPTPQGNLPIWTPPAAASPAPSKNLPITQTTTKPNNTPAKSEPRLVQGPKVVPALIRSTTTSKTPDSRPSTPTREAETKTQQTTASSVSSEKPVRSP